MKETSARIKIGIVTIVSALLFVLMVVALSKLSIRPQRELRIYFSFINSLERKAPVRFAGARVGEVKSIQILTTADRAEFPRKNVPSREVSVDRRSDKSADSSKKVTPPYVCIIASINRDTAIPKATKAMVNTMGFMGEKYLELIPDTSAESIEYMADNDFLIGIDPTPMDTVFASAQQLAEEMRISAKDVRTIVVEMQDRLPVLIGEFDKTLASAQQLAGDARILTKDVQSMVNTNRENLEKLIANTRQITIFMKSFSHVLATRPWKLIWGFGGPIPVEPEDVKYSAPPEKSSHDTGASKK